MKALLALLVLVLGLAPVRVHVALLGVTSSPSVAALVLAAETAAAAVALVFAIRVLRRSWPHRYPAWFPGGAL